MLPPHTASRPCSCPVGVALPSGNGGQFYFRHYVPEDQRSAPCQAHGLRRAGQGGRAPRGPPEGRGSGEDHGNAKPSDSSTLSAKHTRHGAPQDQARRGVIPYGSVPETPSIRDFRGADARAIIRPDIRLVNCDCFAVIQRSAAAAVEPARR